MPTASPSSTHSGIPAIGDVSWGAHFCSFYRTGEDLADSLVPYFKAGLERNEQCLWVTSEPLGVEESRTALRRALPRVDDYEARGQLEILDHRDWYERLGRTTMDGVLRGWVERKEAALARGRAGLRLTGNTYFLERNDWRSFAEYEAKVTETFQEHEIVALCSYCLTRCEPEGILDVVRNHQFAVVRREGGWEVLESASLKVAKEELRRLNLELERRVGERTAELEAALAEQKRARQEALEAVRVRDEFLSVASHELKTPLTSLKLQLELVKSALVSAGRELAGQLAGRLRTMERQVARLDALNMGLLDVGLLGSGRLHLHLQRVDFAAVLHEALERLAPELDRVHCEVHLDVRGDVQGRWDALRLDQVVVNLLTNAAKYGPGKPIHVSLRVREGHAVLSVRDEGIGIASEALGRLFRKFERAVPAQKYGGLGLGLYISRTLVEAMGGAIDVASTPGRGSTFTVRLPLEPAAR